MSRFKPPLAEDRAFVIAEVGSNHMGSYSSAIDHIVEAKNTGADAAKFQLFRPEDILVDPSKCDPRTVMPPEWVPRLHAACLENGIHFMCTPFSEWAVDILNPYVDIWKVGSFEYKRDDVLWAVHETGKPVIASCGRGFPDVDPAWHLLYCVSEYPTPTDHINFLDLASGMYDGFSDHTLSTVLPALAVANGAIIIEKHFRTTSADPSSPDYSHSLDPTRFSEMVTNIRLAESTCLRPPSKSPEQSRYPNRRE